MVILQDNSPESVLLIAWIRAYRDYGKYDPRTIKAERAFDDMHPHGYNPVQGKPDVAALAKVCVLPGDEDWSPMPVEAREAIDECIREIETGSKYKQ